MLLLTRRPNESVYLTDTRTGEEIAQVKIISVDGRVVRIGFDCPSSISIVRDDAKPLQENSNERDINGNI